MAISDKFLIDALLKYNYLPRQKKDKSETPPSISSRRFTPAVAKKLLSSTTRKKSEGWDVVLYKSTRFNGVTRPLAIPHPIPHANLAFGLAEKWSLLAPLTSSSRSVIRPRKHGDGRIIIMDYETSLSKARNNHGASFAKRFRVHTDIANCFPSVYTHALPWALVGFSTAKANKQPTEWFNKLDERLRWCKRNETNGIAIGPATSSLIIESILGRVDQTIEAKYGPVFTRYIDDYTAYFSTEVDAQAFIRDLGIELEKYKFVLNIKKTFIDQLPEPLVAGWVTSLLSIAPKVKKKTLLGVYEVADFLGASQRLAKEEPDGSVLRFALAILSRAKLRPNAREFLLDEMLVLAFHYPVVLSQLATYLKRAKADPFAMLFKDYEAQLNTLLVEHAFHHRSDAMAWLLHFIRKFNFTVSVAAAQAVLESRDCIALLMLYMAGSNSQKADVVSFAQALDTNNFYELDSHWILLFELFCEKTLSNPYGKAENGFDLMRKSNVRFFDKSAGWK